MDLTHQSSKGDDTNTSSLCSGADHGELVTSYTHKFHVCQLVQFCKVSFYFFFLQSEGSYSSDSSRMTVCSLNECLPNLSVSELQLKDQDEQLEMTIEEQSCLMEQYSSMVDRLNKALNRQNVSEVADSVVRRYRRWRQQSNQSILKKTSAKHRKGRNLNEVRSWSLETTLSPDKQRGSLKRCHRQPVLALDQSAHNGSFEPRDVSLHRTLTLSPFPQTEEIRRSHSSSPSKHYFQPAKSSLNWIHKSERHSPSAFSEKTSRPFMYADQHSVVEDRSSFSSLPVKQSPSKFGAISETSKSPSAFLTRKEMSAEMFFGEPSWPRSWSSLSSPQKSAVPLRVIDPQNTRLFFSPHLKPPTTNRPKFQRSLSFDSSSPSTALPFSPEKVDVDFQKLYHRYACEKKYFNDGPPCSLCTKGLQASRIQSALALSPRSLVWRKRHREQGRDGHPQSKRVRNECSTSSPGSKRYEKEMLRRRHSQSELSGYDLSSSRYRLQQRSTNVHQEINRSQEPSDVNTTFFPTSVRLHQTTL